MARDHRFPPLTADILEILSLMTTTTLNRPIEKPADTHHPIHPYLQHRWSPRAFDERPVDPATLRSVLEAARWAPSANNRQPWRFIVATKGAPEAYARLLGILNERNAAWARQAPVLMLVVAQLYQGPDGQPSMRSLYDVGLAVGNLTTQATAHDLAAHQMGGFDGAKARADLRIPEGYEPVAAIALGYAGDPTTLPDDLRERESAPRARNPLQDIVFEGEWDRPLPQLSDQPR